MPHQVTAFCISLERLQCFLGQELIPGGPRPKTGSERKGVVAVVPGQRVRAALGHSENRTRAMRKSPFLLAGVAVAAAAAATSAFTAGNTFAPGVQTKIAGFG